MRGCLRKLGIFVGILSTIIVVVGVATWVYWYRGGRLAEQAWDAYYEGRPVEALALYRTIRQQYPSWWLFEDIALSARYNAPELEDYLHAVSLQDSGQVDEAIAAYESFLEEHYPEYYNYKSDFSANLYLSHAREALANLKLEQAQAFQDNGQYAEAIEVYQSVLELRTNGGDYCAPQGSWDKWGAACQEADVAIEEGQAQAQVAIPAVFLEWSEVLAQQENYEEYIAKYQAVLREYPGMVNKGQAQATLAEVYGAWAVQLREMEDYESAIEKYQAALQEYPDTLNRDQAEAILAELYGEWAAQLRAAGDYERAIEKYQAILRECPDTPTGAQAEATLAELYGEWAAQLREAEEYEEAIEKYQTILREYPDTPTAAQADAAMAETHEELAAWREQTQAVPVAEFPQELSRDAEDRWSWTIVFKETGGKIGYTLSGEGWIVDVEGQRWGTYGSLITRGSVTVPAGGQAENSYWCRGDTFVDGYATFTWSGEDAHGHPITIEEKVHLLP
jgi:tetratricopeptide (TPR) repeat protein